MHIGAKKGPSYLMPSFKYLNPEVLMPVPFINPAKNKIKKNKTTGGMGYSYAKVLKSVKSYSRTALWVPNVYTAQNNSLSRKIKENLPDKGIKASPPPIIRQRTG